MFARRPTSDEPRSTSSGRLSITLSGLRARKRRQNSPPSRKPDHHAGAWSQIGGLLAVGALSAVSTGCARVVDPEASANAQDVAPVVGDTVADAAPAVDPAGCLSAEGSARLWRMSRDFVNGTVLLDEASCVAYVTDASRGLLAEVDLHNGTLGRVRRTALVGIGAYGVVRSLDGSRFLVATDAPQELAVVDAATFAVQRPLALSPPPEGWSTIGGPPALLAPLGADRLLAVFGRGSDSARMTTPVTAGAIDLVSGAIELWTAPGDGGWNESIDLSLGIASSPRGETAMIFGNTLDLLPATAAGPRAPIPAPSAGPHGDTFDDKTACVSPDGARMLVGSGWLLTPDGAMVGRWTMGYGPVACAFTPDGQAAWAITFDDSLAEYHLVQTSNDPGTPWFRHDRVVPGDPNAGGAVWPVSGGRFVVYVGGALDHTAWLHVVAAP